MNYEDFKEVIHGRQSVRKFTEQEVATSDIKDIIDCARYAPSGYKLTNLGVLGHYEPREKLKKLNK
ncbi:nitroreductase family protein [Bacillus pacificus]